MPAEVWQLTVMDPITAIRIAGSIVQFVDFGLKVVSKGNHIYRSGDGSLSEDHDPEVLTKDLVLFNARMQCALQPVCGGQAYQGPCLAG